MVLAEPVPELLVVPQVLAGPVFVVLALVDLAFAVVCFVVSEFVVYLGLVFVVVFGLAFAGACIEVCLVVFVVAFLDLVCSVVFVPVFVVVLVGLVFVVCFAVLVGLACCFVVCFD